MEPTEEPKKAWAKQKWADDSRAAFFEEQAAEYQPCGRKTTQGSKSLTSAQNADHKQKRSTEEQSSANRPLLKQPKRIARKTRAYRKVV
jgi:hypothetical protein